MLSRAVPIVGMILSCTALIVAVAAASAERPPVEDMGPRLEDARRRLATLHDHLVRTDEFLSQKEQGVDRAEKAAEGLRKSISQPAEKDLKGAVGEVLGANWPQFIHAYYYASGRIGVLSAEEQRRVGIFERMWRPGLKKHALTEEQGQKAARIMAEAQALFGKARPLLAGWPEALEIERRRLVDDAHRKFKSLVAGRRADALRQALEERLR